MTSMADTAPDPTRILEEEIQRARDAGDHGRLLALASALLGTVERTGGRAQAGPDARAQALKDLIGESARTLIEASVPGDLEAALGWAMTWMKLCRSEAARAWIGSLQERIAGVRAREEVLRLALTHSNRRALMDAIKAFVVSPDRCPGSETMIADAKRTLSERLEQAHRLRLEIDGLLPATIDQAVALIPRLLALDAAPEYDDLKHRLEDRAIAVAARQARVEEALKAGVIPPLARTLDELIADGDRLSTTPALLERARATLAELNDQLARHRADLLTAGTQRIDHALTVLAAMIRLDPTVPEASQLPTLRAQHSRLTALHQRIETSLPNRSGRQLNAAVRELNDSPHRLSSSQELLDSAQVTTRRFRRRDHQRRHVRNGALVLVAVAVVAIAALWLRGRMARAAIDAAGDPDERLRLAQGYAGSGHLFGTAEVAALAVRLAGELDEAAYRKALDASDPVDRLAHFDTYRQRPGARDVSAELTAARRDVVERGFEAALAIPDVDRRIAALDAFAASAPPDAAEKARLARAGVVAAREQGAWQKVIDAAGPDHRLAALASYDALPAPRRHDADAARLRSEAEAAQVQRQAEAVDDVAWARARATIGDEARINACTAYLDGPTIKRHTGPAQAEITAARARIDDIPWQVAQGVSGDAPTRIAAYQAYLAAPTVQGHARTANEAIDRLRAGIDDEAWAAATVAGDAGDRLARLRAYLSGPTTRAHRAEAETASARIAGEIDQAAFNQAMAVADLEGRITALDGYLAGDGQRNYTAASREASDAALRQLATLPVDRLAALPLPLLQRIPAKALQRLAPAQLARLPPTVQMTVTLTPPWASDSGVDRHGRWAVLLVAGAPVRFRHILPGTVALPDGRQVTGARGLWMGEQEVSQGLWEHIAGTVKTAYKGGDLPIDSVSRDQCQDFIDQVNVRLRRVQIDAEVRLPTSAEWRWAAFTGNGGPTAVERATATLPEGAALRALTWSVDAGATAPRPVDRGEPDGWGCLNLFGNVAEWCADDHERSPHWRGGSWRLAEAECTPDRTGTGKTSTRSPDVGLRLVIGK